MKNTQKVEGNDRGVEIGEQSQALTEQNFQESLKLFDFTEDLRPKTEGT